MNMILTMSSFIFPIITFPYIARVLQPAGTGRVSFATSFILYFIIISQLGIPTYGIRECAKVRDDRNKLTKTVHELLMISIIMSLVSYAVLFILIYTVPRLQDDRTLLIITSLSIILNTIGMEWLYKGLEQYTFITVRSIAFKLISVIAMFLLIHGEKDYVLYGAICMFAGYGSNVVNIIYSRKFIDVTIAGKYDLRRHLKPVMVFFAMSCATTIYVNLDTVMLGFMTGDKEVGYYHASVRIKTILTSIITSLGAVLLPRLSYYIERGEEEKFREVCMKSFRFVTAAAVPAMAYFMLFAREAIRFIAGKDYAGSVLPMQIMMPTVLFIGITNIIGIQIFIPYGKEKTVLMSVTAGAIVDLIINLILIPVYGSSGAAAGTVTAEFVVLIIQWIIFKKELPPGFFRELHIPGIIAALGAAILSSFWVKGLDLGSFLKIAVSGTLFFAAYILVFLLMGGAGDTKLPALLKGGGFRKNR